MSSEINERPTDLTRRTVVRAAAWGTPVVTGAAMAPAYALSGLGAACSPPLAVVGGSWETVSGPRRARPGGGPRGWSPNSSNLLFTGGRDTEDSGTGPQGRFLSYANGVSGTGNSAAEDTVLRVAYRFAVPASVARVQVAAKVELGYGNGGGGTERQTVSMQIQDGSTLVGTPMKFALRRFNQSASANVPPYTAVTLLKRSEQVVAADHIMVTHSNPTLVGPTERTFFTSVIPLTGTGARTVSVVYTLTLDGQRDTWIQDDVILHPPAMYPC